MLSDADFRKLKVWATSPARRLYQEAVDARARVRELFILLEGCADPLVTATEKSRRLELVTSALEQGRREGFLPEKSPA